MIANQTVIAIIPARGGSKGIPRKNVRDLCGKPLIAWTIESALRSRYIDTVLVTSDDKEILQVSKKYGAQTIQRPSYLASDESPSIDAVIHALQQKEQHDIVILLQPTSPLRNEYHINESLELFIKKVTTSLVSVSEVTESPYWMYKIKAGKLKPLLEDIAASRRQDLPKIYKLNGAIYIKKQCSLVKEKFFIDENTYSYIMPVNTAIDIDNRIDWEMVSHLIKER